MQCYPELTNQICKYSFRNIFWMELTHLCVDNFYDPAPNLLLNLKPKNVKLCLSCSFFDYDSKAIWWWTKPTHRSFQIINFYGSSRVWVCLNSSKITEAFDASVTPSLWGFNLAKTTDFFFEKKVETEMWLYKYCFDKIGEKL